MSDKTTNSDFNRRQFITAVMGTVAASGLPLSAFSATGDSKGMGHCHRLPFQGLRIIELSNTLTGRLAGLLFADQGAEVLIAREAGFKPDEQDEFLDRNKTSVVSAELADTSSADVIIVDELSMVDVPLAWHLFRSVDLEKTAVVLVGDHNQLPPVAPLDSRSSK